MSKHEAYGMEIAQLMEEARGKDAEIERLKSQIKNLETWITAGRSSDRDAEYVRLLQRAREATKDDQAQRP